MCIRDRLKIDVDNFSPREVMNHITANYLPLVVRKQLGLYCFIEPDVPVALLSLIHISEPTRL